MPPPRVYKTAAIVLRQRPLGEAQKDRGQFLNVQAVETLGRQDFGFGRGLQFQSPFARNALDLNLRIDGGQIGDSCDRSP